MSGKRQVRALGQALFYISARAWRSRWYSLLRNFWFSVFSPTVSNYARKDNNCATHSKGTGGVDCGVEMRHSEGTEGEDGGLARRYSEGTEGSDGGW